MASGMKPLKLVLRGPRPAAAAAAAPAAAAAVAAAAPDWVASSWPVLRSFLEAVFSFGVRASGHSFEELYRTIEDVVAARHSRQLYELLRSSMRDNAGVMVQRLLSAGSSQDAASFLGCVAATWASHRTQLVVIRNVFLYLDRTFVRDAPGALSVYDLGVSIFRDALVSRRELLSKIVNGMLSLVSADRQGQLVDRQLLSAFTRMLSPHAGLSLYASDLQPGLLTEADAFYLAEGLRATAALDVPQYLAHAEALLHAEVERVHACLDAGVSLRPLRAISEQRLLAAHSASLLDRGCSLLLDAGRIDDLRRLHALLLLVRQTEELRKRFAEHTRVRLIELVAEKDDDKDKRLVSDLLEYRAGMVRLVSLAFRGDDGFLVSLKSSLEAGINSRESKPAELIAKFVDSLMRGGSRSAAASAKVSSSSSSLAAADDGTAADVAAGALSGAGSGEELDALLESVMVLFRCIHGKDVFEAFYKKDLAKRLLLGKSTSSDAEKAMVARLKAECGSQFTAKLEGMFKDSDLAKELMAQYESSPARAALASREALGEVVRTPDLHVHVLTSSYWPTYPPTTVVLPAELAPALDSFAAFYKAKYNAGRRLQWQHNLGHCLVRAVFPSGRKELDVSFFQALVLLLFNDGHDALPLEAIRDRTAIEDGELRRTLQSLACGQVRVLRKEPKGREVGDGDVFHFNADFKAPLIRIKINTIQLRETKAEVDATHERVASERQYQVDAAIVRVMKSRKTLSYQALLAELFAQLRFPIKAADIKKRVESLVDRDYLERDEADANLFRYVA